MGNDLKNILDIWAGFSYNNCINTNDTVDTVNTIDTVCECPGESAGYTGAGISGAHDSKREECV